ncbi:hypothetical protein NQ317_008253 [Molorchus minor]|uniref:Uncharacterized protein n=1 Tax=Molorchus minor TaxID=1323400 RepID=A0ABQ9JC17_9CUCU|nr:hypothetical protein NQ317_008253 [Molorchus minor]
MLHQLRVVECETTDNTYYLGTTPAKRRAVFTDGLRRKIVRTYENSLSFENFLRKLAQSNLSICFIVFTSLQQVAAIMGFAGVCWCNETKTFLDISHVQDKESLQNYKQVTILTNTSQFEIIRNFLIIVIKMRQINQRTLCIWDAGAVCSAVVVHSLLTLSVSGSTPELLPRAVSHIVHTICLAAYARGISVAFRTDFNYFKTKFNVTLDVEGRKYLRHYILKKEKGTRKMMLILFLVYRCTMNNCESEEIVEAANIAISNLLPTKSRSLYDIAYNRFKKWCAEKNVQVYSENVLLVYFSENAKNYKSSTLWAQYSMVKSCLIIYDNIDISKFPKLIAFLKRTGDGYQAKKIENIDKE